MMKSFCLFFIFIFTQGNFFVLVQSNKNETLDLVNRFKDADGGEVFELNYEISKQLVANDVQFFDVMSSNMREYMDWIMGLQAGTFTCYVAEDSVDVILYDAMLSKLKELMLKKIKIYIRQPRYRKMAKMLREKLNKISVKFIE